MLDWDSLYSEAGARAVTGGKKRFYDNRVTNISTARRDGKFVVRASVQGDRNYETEVQFDERGGLYDYSCDCPSDKTSEGPCRHIVATALAYENKFPQEQTRGTAETVARRSDAGIRALIEQYGRMRRGRRIAEEGEKVKIVPTMEIGEGGRLKLKFTVGSKKMYTLKDVSDFVSCWNTGAEKRYGIELTVTHVPESFDELSASLAAFISGCWREKVEFLADAHALNPDYRDELRLSAGGVDEFMRLFAGHLVGCGDSFVKGGICLIVQKSNAAEVGFSVGKVSGGYVLECKLHSHRVLFGKENKYIVSENRIYPVTDAYYNAVMPVVNAVQARGRLFVAESDMSQFYNSVLTRVIAFTEIAAPDVNLSVFEAAPLELGVYLNALPQGGIEATLHASYDGENEVDILDENSSSPFVRDYESEGAFLQTLKKYFPDFPLLTVSDEADVYLLLREGLRELMGSAEVYLSDDIKKMKVRKPPRMKVGVRIKSDLLGLELSSEEYSSAELAEILRAYKNKRNYVRLTDGSFVDLLDPSIAAISEVAEIASVSGDDFALPLYYAPYVDYELKSGFFNLERSAEFKQMIKELSDASESLAEVPEKLKPVLRNYQKAGFRWLKTLTRMGFGGILADDMGLGKTLQIIALLVSEKQGASIVVCPTTLVLNWVNEFNKFAPELKVLAVSGNGEERKELVSEFKKYDVVVTSYELLRRDAPLYAKERFCFAVLDEAQYIKNPETRNARAVKTLNAKYRFALTGTPVENSLAELWSIFDFLMPGYLFSYQKFRDTLESEIVRGNDAAAQRLSRLIKPFVLRRLKSGVLKELPPKMESNVLCPLEGEQLELYSANLGLVKESVKAAGEKVNKVVVLSMLTKLRQICCEPSLVYSDYKGNSSKLNACLELIRSASQSGHKVLVFSQFTSMLEILRSKLAEEGITHYLLQGDTPKAERVKLVSRFNSDRTEAFLISLKAGGTGLNLTGADVVIHYDPWWNESVMNQATDRAYRIGQEKSVQVYKLIMQDSIEQRIMKLQEKKNALSDIVMHAASGGVNLKVEEILELLS